jgi:hypothetical protein
MVRRRPSNPPFWKKYLFFPNVAAFRAALSVIKAALPSEKTANRLKALLAAAIDGLD